MFPKNSKEIVLIGEPYRSKESFSLLDSKVGGLPVLLLLECIISSYGLQTFQRNILFTARLVERKCVWLFR